MAASSVLWAAVVRTRSWLAREPAENKLKGGG